MWIKIDATQLQRWKSPVVDEWVEITNNNTAQVTEETGEKLIATYDFVTET